MSSMLIIGNDDPYGCERDKDRLSEGTKTLRYLKQILNIVWLKLRTLSQLPSLRAVTAHVMLNTQIWLMA